MSFVDAWSRRAHKPLLFSKKRVDIINKSPLAERLMAMDQLNEPFSLTGPRNPTS